MSKFIIVSTLLSLASTAVADPSPAVDARPEVARLTIQSGASTWTLSVAKNSCARGELHDARVQACWKPWGGIEATYERGGRAVPDVLLHWQVAAAPGSRGTAMARMQNGQVVEAKSMVEAM